MIPSLVIQSIHLRVADLARSIEFYSDRLSFEVLSRTERSAALGVTPDSPAILFLSENEETSIPPPDAAGLFHAALLLPDRAALARWLRHAVNAGVRFDGFSDHGVSEAVYLADPDGNGLEFYVDRPREIWPHADGHLAMFTRPLDVAGLLAQATPPLEPLLARSGWGHLHLRVTHLDEAESFYATTFALKRTQSFGPQARFLSADNYHHHFGLNTWGGVRRPQPPGALGFAEATIASTAIARPMSLVAPDGLSFRALPR